MFRNNNVIKIDIYLTNIKVGVYSKTMLRYILRKIQKFDTPFYIYDEDLIWKNIETLLKNFTGCKAKIFFAVKANTSIFILNRIRKKNIGAEVVSPGEIFICLKAGFNPRKILYNNVARKEDEVIYAIKKGIVFYNFEAIDQAICLEKCAEKLKKEIKIFVRVNPGIFSETHPHLSTGSSTSKFGIEMGNLKKAINLIKKFRFARIVGIHCHIGSQILSPLPFVRAVKKVVEGIELFKKEDMDIEYVNLGGGFGVQYHPREGKLNFTPIVKAYEKLAKDYNVKIFLEPGRFIVSNAGYIVTKVISVKEKKGLPLYIIDAGMTENPRPALYGAYHHIEPIFRKKGKRKKIRIAGPLCENSDEFGIYNLPELKIGDSLLIYNCGAYTRTMASNYNGRILPAEYIFNRNSLKIIRERQKFESLIENEIY